MTGNITAAHPTTRRPSLSSLAVWALALIFAAVVIVQASMQTGAAAWCNAVILLAFAATTCWLALIDIATHRLPNRIVVPAIAIAIAALLVASVTQDNIEAFVRAMISAAVIFLVALSLALIAPRSIGGGDVKLLALTSLVTAWIGWPALMLGILAAFIGAGLVSLVAIARGNATRKSTIPFGPYLYAGALIAITVTLVLS